MKRHEVTTRRFLVALSAVGLMAAGLALAPGASAQTVDPPGAIIDNGTVQLGVHDTANLNFSCTSETDPGCPGPGSSLSGTSAVGLRFMQYNADGTAPGCLCEGWGAADAGSGLTGYANVAGGTSNLTVDSFTATATSAVSVVTIDDTSGHAMQVTHDYHPATGTPNLYEVLVTIENTGTEPLTDVRYRRVMDWDVEPTAFSEWVTIQGTTGATNLLFDSDQGFASSDPLSGNAYLSSPAVCGADYPGACDFVDLGAGGEYPGTTSPSDHGALFDFGFGSLDPGGDVSFRTYYGAAGSGSDALTALGTQSVEIYSLGEPNCPESSPDDSGDVSGCSSLPAHAGVENGQPVTFMFAFSGVGGDPVLPGPLAISKEADEPTSPPGGENGYTITVTNPNAEPVDVSSIEDTLPAGFSYVPGSTSGLTTDDPSIAGQTLTWTGPFSVPPGDSTLQFNVTVSETPGEYDNQASVHFGEETSSTEPTATIEVVEPPEEPSIEKAADSGTTEAGGQNGYTITITNPTPESGSGAGFTLDTITYDFITDTLPAGFSYVPGSTSGLTTDDPTIDGQTLTWTGTFSVPSESTATLSFDVIVSTTPGQYLNDAAVFQGTNLALQTGPTAPIDVTAAALPPPPPSPGPVSLPCDPITAEGGPGGDRMIGGIGADRIRSLGGRDIVDTGSGNDEICGGEGGDFLYGRADFDTLRGEGGNDRLYGGLDADTLYGDAGHDALIGGKAADAFFTQDGVQDCIVTGKGADTITGDVGLDLVDPKGGCPPGFWV